MLNKVRLYDLRVHLAFNLRPNFFLLPISPTLCVFFPGVQKVLKWELSPVILPATREAEQNLLLFLNGPWKESACLFLSSLQREPWKPQRHISLVSCLQQSAVPGASMGCVQLCIMHLSVEYHILCWVGGRNFFLSLANGTFIT